MTSSILDHNVTSPNQLRVLNSDELDLISGGGGAGEGIAIGSIVVNGYRGIIAEVQEFSKWFGQYTGIADLNLIDNGNGTVTNVSSVTMPITPSNTTTYYSTPQHEGMATNGFSSTTGTVVVPNTILVQGTFDYDKDGNTDAFRTPSGDTWAYDVHTGQVLGTVEKITVTASVANGAQSNWASGVSGSVAISPSFGATGDVGGNSTHTGTNGVTWEINPNASQSRLQWNAPNNHYDGH